MAARTSKSISERIEADYYKRPHPMRKAKRWLSWGFFIGSLVLVLLPLALGRREVYQAAPVSPAHQFIANDCARCHAEAWQPALRLVTLDANHRSTTDAACRSCHDTADHFGSLPTEPAPHCADCHREHRPEQSLARTTDQHCIRCHATLTIRSKDGSEIQPVRDIASHPEIALFRSGAGTDPTNLHFNHSVHVAAKGVAGPDGKLVKLECVNCHQPDSNRHLMKPVTYEANCAQCHSNSLQFDQERFPGQKVPHAAAEVVRGFLREQYYQWAEGQNRPSAPGQLPRAAAPSAEEQAEADRLQRSALRNLLGEPEPKQTPDVDQAEFQVFARSGGCRYCHTVVTESVADDSAAGENLAETWKVVEPAMPARWLKGAVFPHVSHRMLTCVACHPVHESTQTADLHVPTIDNCKQCHSPAIAGSMAASSHCTSCHNYHDHEKDLNFDGQLTLELTKFLEQPLPEEPAKTGEQD